MEQKNKGEEIDRGPYLFFDVRINIRQQKSAET
jgi:hypothetical protein